MSALVTVSVLPMEERASTSDDLAAATITSSRATPRSEERVSTIDDLTLTLRLMDDHQLVRDAAGGDAHAFDELVRRHTDTAWRMARSMLRDDFAAEEAVQDTFLKAYRNLHTFRGDAKVSTWLLSICRTTCIDRLRLKKAQVIPLEDMSREPGRSDRPELRVAIERAMAQLPDDERQAFELVEVLGHTRDEAATIVGVPASTMRSRVSRAREKLAKALGDAREETVGE